MVRAPESDAQSAIFALLQSNGWREPEIKNLKRPEQPFHHDDPTMRACYESAIKKKVESWCIQIQSMKPNALLRSN